ncbi:MAG TPA: hybrid sensor histidine kinase/response regulator [Bacteroidota bacterium]|nr:hybrid sensor histidine kinase/response regulator [Bacteroidota bacterium]
MITSLRILLVEDSVDDALLIMRQIMKGGYAVEFERVETAETLKSALDEKRWDIVLSDFMLPRFNGLDAMRLFQEADVDIPFIVVSGAIGEEVAAAAVKAGAHDYILKDNYSRLLPTIERELRNATIRRERLLLELKYKKTEERLLKRIVKKEKELNSLRAKFISTASHEFKTPLTTIHSSAQLLEKFGRTWDEKLFRSQVDRIKENVHYLVQLIDDILLINKVDTKTITFRPKAVNVRSLCDQLVDDIRPLLLSHHDFLYESRLTHEKYLVDANLIKIMTVNLLSNAVRYSSEGGKIMLTAAEQHKSLILSVSYEGTAVTKDELKCLTDSSSPRKNIGDITGTGLGLSIVKQTVDMHGGKIEYRNATGSRITFTITLPVC